MNLTTNYPVMVFVNEYNGKKIYTLGLSRKDSDGKYINGSIGVGFKRGQEPNHMDKITITRGMLDFYLVEKGEKKVTIPKVFVFEYIKQTKKGEKSETITNDFLD